MRTNFRIVYLIAIPFLLAHCTQPPKIEAPSLPEVKIDLKTCDKKDSELNISDQAKENTIVVKDKIPSQDLEKVDCDGKIEKTHEPVRGFHHMIEVEAPAELSDQVTYVKIENSRTCSAEVFESQDKLTDVPDISSEGDRDGNLRIMVSDLDVKIDLFTNIREGTNLLKVSYFGKCRKYREGYKKDSKSQLESCQESELLKTKEILLKVEIERPDIPGVRKIDTCSKK